SPEIRLAVGEPDLDIGNLETALEGLSPPNGSCYYLNTTQNRYWFSTKPNLTKLLSDKRAGVEASDIREEVRKVIQTVFKAGEGVERSFFPEQSSQIPDRPALMVVITPPERSMADDETLSWIGQTTREYGASSRTFKSALIWCVAENEAPLKEDARKLLAWEAIEADSTLGLDESQQRQLSEGLKRARTDLKECVWRSYKNILLLGQNQEMRQIDMGLVNSSQATSLLTLIVSRLRQEGDIEKDISPNFLLRHWPGAFEAWSTKGVRDAFFASPLFPRLEDGNSVKGTIARGVREGKLAYVGKGEDGKYEPLVFEAEISESDVEISDEMFIITGEVAKKHQAPPELKQLVVEPETSLLKPSNRQSYAVKAYDQNGMPLKLGAVTWETTGGTIDDSGVLVACEEEGNYIVTAKTGDVAGTARFSVSTQIDPPPPPLPDPPPKKKRSFAWSGPINPQKWTQFYMKVLTKFAADSNIDLKLNVSMEVTAKEGQELSEQKIDETKTALRELGMDKS
ncbi:MAG: AAA family ATPase, partial [Planctomycetota bacterium]|nr:AAA family ATPase [Planctomycetota bacterium]